MSPLPVDSFICFAIWTESVLNPFYKPESESLLIYPCLITYSTLDALLGHLDVFLSSIVVHGNLLSRFSMADFISEFKCVHRVYGGIRNYTIDWFFPGRVASINNTLIPMNITHPNRQGAYFIAHDL